MTKEALETLAELGFDLSSKLSVPANLDLNMRLSVVPMGNVTVLLCNGGQGEYDTLANHGAIRREVEQKSVCADTVPYLTVPTSRLFSIFRSIATMRVLLTGDKQTVRNHQRIANETAKAWITSLPRESNAVYQRDIAANEFAESLSL